MGTIVLKCNVVNNKLHIEENIPDEFNNQEVVIEISKPKRKRSLSQNNWYYGVALPIIMSNILEYTGEEYTKDDLHEFHLEKVVMAHKVVKETLGETIITYTHKRTSDMTTTEFMDFKNQIQTYWAERGINIPDPNQNDFI